MIRTSGRTLDATRRGRTFSGMGHGKKKFSDSRGAPKKGPPLGLVIALAAAAGVVIGSAGTYLLARPAAVPKQAVAPAAAGTPQMQSLPPRQQFKPAPQPPGEAPPGKVWSVEHGHWHDALGAATTPAPAPVTLTIPAPVPAAPVPETTPAPAPVTVTPPATTTPAPATPEKK